MRLTSLETHILLLNKIAATIFSTALTSVQPILKGPISESTRVSLSMLIQPSATLLRGRQLPAEVIDTEWVT